MTNSQRYSPKTAVQGDTSDFRKSTSLLLLPNISCCALPHLTSGFTSANPGFGHNKQDTNAMATTLATVYDGIIRDTLDRAQLL